MKRIEKITIERIPDYDSQLDYLGTFSDEAGEFAVKHEGERGQYAYFNADNVENMKQAKQNYDRVMQYEKGNILDYGVKATAEITTGNKNWRLLNKISSGGLWGMSSDTDDSEFESEEQNQLDELTDVLIDFGFTKQEVKAAKIERGAE